MGSEESRNRGDTRELVQTKHVCSNFSIRGVVDVSGLQRVEPDGPVPWWVYGALRTNKDIDSITIGQGDRAVVYTRPDD